ncbi:ion channel protein [Agromyces bauzanensis]|uniref:Ion-transport protein YfeO n=1 Tax=Agromyces bauzanensis TaxID=1308924 RepID=A0A917PV23_9MICO|nr:ion channel protein [Agromyces bauzanensis]GGJ92865.1 putative ion-transport protein YfeO [Agromyces bauzanensis]
MSLARTPTEGGASPRQLLVLAIPAIIVGVFAALLLWSLEQLADLLGGVLWKTAPDALGVDPNGWWIVLILTLTGLAVGLGLRFMPGHGGPDSATTELIGPPLPLRVLPGLALVTIFSLAGGVSLGPENPIIAINGAIAVALLTRLLPQVPRQISLLIAGSATVGALFGTPVAAALLFTGIVAAAKGGGSLWDRLFLPIAAAGSGAITMHLLGSPSLDFDLPPYGSPQAIDLLTGSLVACGAVAISLAALVAFPVLWRGLHALRHPIIIPLVGGFLLGILGLIGGPITMFKGLAQIGDLLEDPGAYDGGQLALIAGIKLLALLVAASALFRGGRIFPATFIGVALGMLGHVLIPGLPLGLAVACGILGVVLVIGRDGWLAIFIGVAIPGDITLLPMLCVIILPAWLLVSWAPEFRIVPPAPAPVPTGISDGTAAH